MAKMDFNLTSANPMPKVGYAFVPMQTMGETYLPAKSLMRGTLFPELDITMEEYGRQYLKEDNYGTK